MTETDRGERAAAAGWGLEPRRGGPREAEIHAQLKRIASAGFVPNAAQRSSEGQAEYITALADLPPTLLVVAVDRIIRLRENKFFPLPGEIRAMVADELALISRSRNKEICRRINEEMLARYPGRLLLAGD